MSQVFINIVGHNSSGKTTLAKRLEEDLGLSRISGDDFRQFIHEHVAYFHDIDMSYPNKRYGELNPLVIQYRFELCEILLHAGQSVIFDGSGATQEHRARYLEKIKAAYPPVARVLIWADVPEQELLVRLEKRGSSWLEQYHNLKKHSFQPPSDNESEVLLHYDQNNYEDICSHLQKILA